MGTVIGMYTATDSAASASIDVPANGNLIGVDWDVQADLDSDLDELSAELSFGSTSGLTTNDTRSRISTCSAGHLSVVASGAQVSNGQKYVSLPDIPVGLGERIYLHTLSVGSPTNVRVLCNLHFDFNLDRAMVRRR